ncbi:thiamine diphosphokinase [Alteribacillus persepolensis]|uniref:Thiamine diphosphokinase n=2 Tax=Alteribacillus persepolensis TaxID=568899 RepID=A0A1G8C9M8_9BACI|nr:thiamine diphosphokinase [Alteribacillus persepolensis]
MRVLLFAGGTMEEDFFSAVTEDDYLIGVDSGAYALIEHGYIPHLAVGDFDSVTPEQKDDILLHSVEWKSCDPVDKDKTDTEIGLESALEKQPHKIVMFGVTGTRLDHTLSNIYLLERACEEGVEAEIIDKHNKLFVAGRYTKIEKDMYSYVSIIPISEKVKGLSLKGFVYPLDNACLERGQTLGISNQIKGAYGEITVKSGHILVVKSSDGKV